MATGTQRRRRRTDRDSLFGPGQEVARSRRKAPIPWVIGAEIFPTKLRGRAMSLAIMMLWLADFVVTQTFSRLRETIGPAHTFWLYAFFSLVSVIFVVGMVPETKGRTLEEIEALWGRKSSWGMVKGTVMLLPEA